MVEILADHFITGACHAPVNIRQLLEERFVRVSNELIEKMWAKIDTQEFVNKILTKNYTLYSIDNWSRKNDSI